ncbi:unnamed protein product [Allacma fusca]|uniref:Uncharacterized protein n=1 Tax=Allacma fusca TaxID=39272 RepID=A0A8J2JBF9_9HEXA|nr:unnamed protein product [Allacma fusca]
MWKKLILLAFIPIISCSEELRKAMDDAKCKGHDLNVSEKRKAVIVDCSMQLGIKSKSDFTPEKLPCFSKCLIEKQGLVDENGKPHKEKILQIQSDSKLPEELKAEIRKLMGDCLDEHGSKIQMDDKTCKSFEPLTMCVHKSYMTLCKEK